MTHIEEARNTAQALGNLGTTHPRYTQVALTGILHALLALHEQGEAPQFSAAARTAAESLRTKATKNIATPKETSK